MRKYILFGVFIAFLPLFISAQSCLPNGIWLTSQQEVNDFKVFYPNCKVIEGDLQIFGEDITNLSPLIGITDVKGDLIVECPALGSLSGLNNIKTTGGLYLAGNSLLTSLAPLSKLSAVNGFFFIQGNPKLTNLNGLQNLKTVGGDFWIHYSLALTDLSALNGLTNISGEIFFNYASAIKDLSGLKNLSTLGGGLNVWWCDELNSLSGLEKIGTVLDSLVIQGCPKLTNLNGLPKLTQINGKALFIANNLLADLSALSDLTRIDGELRFWGLPNLSSVSGLSSLQSIGSSFVLSSNGALKNFTGLNNLQSIGNQLLVQHYSALESFDGLENLQSIGGGLRLLFNTKLGNIAALSQVKNLNGGLYAEYNTELTDLTGLQGLETMGGDLILRNNAKLADLLGLQNLKRISESLVLDRNDALANLKVLGNLTQIGDSVVINSNANLSAIIGLNRLSNVPAALILNGNTVLANLQGLDSLRSAGSLSISSNYELSNIAALSQLTQINGAFQLIFNPKLGDLAGLEQLQSVGGKCLLINNGLKTIAQISKTNIMGRIEIIGNQSLSECAIELICNKLYNNPDSILINFNHTGCRDNNYVKKRCQNTPVIVEVRAAEGGNPKGRLISDMPVQLSSTDQFAIMPTDASGTARFDYFNNGPFWLSLPQLPAQHWAADSIRITPIKSGDTIRAAFWLTPLTQCADLVAQIGLPSAYEDCKQNNSVQIVATNEGGAAAEGAKLAVTLPSVFVLQSASPTPVAQVGDTLFFDLGKIPALTSAVLRLKVKAQCDPNLAQRSICWGARAQASNVCPAPLGPNIALSAQCIGNATVRFTLQNTGNAPAKNNYQYSIFRNLESVDLQSFSLEMGETKHIELPADGATYRMEATKNDKGQRTAIAIEACNGLAPGLVNAFWQDNGSMGQAYACAQFAAPVQYRRKTAAPSGEGPKHLVPQNKSIQYSIDFQYVSEDSINRDSAFWVRITDALPTQLDVRSFRPVASSHPCSWQISNDRTLEVRFDAISLPDHKVNPEASRGFFTYRMEQEKDLPKGTLIENDAKVYMDKYSAEFPLFRDKYTHTVTSMSGLAQACLPDGIVFEQQSDVDNFPLLYPNCNTIEGDLSIRGDMIYDLSKLSQIKAIGGNLSIENNNLLVELAGLENLQSVGGNLLIFNIEYLDNLSHLSNLRSVGGSFEISANKSLLALQGPPKLQAIGKDFNVVYNRNLKSMAGLGPIRSINGALTLMENDSLQNLEGLNTLDSVGGNFIIKENDALSSLAQLGNLTRVGGLQIASNPLLNDLAGLENIAQIDGDFQLQINLNVLNLNHLSRLEKIGGKFSVIAMSSLKNLNGLQNLKRIGGGLELLNNQNLLDVQGLGDLDTLQFLQVEGNAFLKNLQGLSKLKNIKGNAHFAYNYSLKSFQGLEGLQKISGRVSISSNDSLTNFTGLDQLRYIGDSLFVSYNGQLSDFEGLGGLDSIAGGFNVFSNPVLAHFKGLNALSRIGGRFYFTDNFTCSSYSGLEQLRHIGGDFLCINNAAFSGFKGLENLRHIGGHFFHDANTHLDGLDELRFVGGNFGVNPLLENFKGLKNLRHIGGHLKIDDNLKLTDFQGLDSLRYIGGALYIEDLATPRFHRLTGLSHLEHIGKTFTLAQTQALKNLNELNQLRYIGGDFELSYFDSLASLSGLKNLQTIGGNFSLHHLYHLKGIGMTNLDSIGGSFTFEYNPKIHLLDFEKLRVVDKDFFIRNTQLVSLGNLKKLERIGGHLGIGSNGLLSDCSVAAICKRAAGFDPNLNIYLNAKGCGSQNEVNLYCQSIPVLASILLDQNADCQADANDIPLKDVQVQMRNDYKPTDSEGRALFPYLNNGAFTLSLPQLPNAYWDLCRDDTLISPIGDEDTLRCNFLLRPIVKCPNLEVTLILPANFRGCLVRSELAVLAQNTGTLAGKDARIALVLPDVFELQSTSWPIAAQNKDTLFFDLGDLQVFEKQEIRLQINTRCDTFVLGQTLCLEAFGQFSNACPSIPTASSEIKASAKCLDGKTLQFTLTNIGDAPTTEAHEFKLYRNAGLARIEAFQLDAKQSINIAVTADSATWRLEATKNNSGARTAVALEGCGGLTPGLVTDFWLEKGGPNYDYDCREAIGAYDPNQKTAMPEGHGPLHLLDHGQPLQYTIDFQNTGTDTAYRVLLRDELHVLFDVGTFQPLFASHPYNWQIRDGRFLEVLFQPIALPDSNANEPASHGFFTFSIYTKHLPFDGYVITNKANIIFDYNPPIVTNEVRHTIGQLSVSTDTPDAQPADWEIWGNPARGSAIFKAKSEIIGEKQFELHDAKGQLLRKAVFSGQMFDFQCDGLADGAYFYRITSGKGQTSNGKIVVQNR